MSEEQSKLIEEEKGATEEKNPQDLEVLFGSLEEILEKLEKDEIPLEKAFSLYQQGMEILRKCDARLDEVEKKVQILDEDGESHEF